MPPTSPSHTYARRDVALLQHASLYGLILPAVASKLFFDGKQAGHILKKLSGDGGPLQAFPRALPGGLTYYRLSHRGAISVQAPKERALPLGAAALDFAIGIVYFCCLDSAARRYRAERKDLEPFFGAKAPPANVAHVISDETGRPVLYRVYQATRSHAHTIGRLKDHFATARADKALRDWVSSGEYGIAALLPSSRMVGSFQAAIRRNGLLENGSVIYGPGPSAETLASELRTRKEASE